jgi:hypothetical protein
MSREPGNERALASFAYPTGREIGLLVAVGIFVLAISLAALGPRWWRIGLVGEWVTYMLLAFAILSWRPFRSVLARTSRGQRTAVAATLLLLALGQFVGGGRQTFPLVRFQMFTDPAATELRQYHLLGVTKTGERIPVDPVVLFPSLDRGRFEGKLGQTTEAALEDGPGSDAANTYEGILMALLERHNKSARNPIVRLDVYALDLPLDPPPRDRVAAGGARVWSVEAKR